MIKCCYVPACAAFLFVLAGHSDSAFAKKPKKDFTSAIGGSWAGKLKTTAFSLEEGGGKERAVQSLTLSITNESGAIKIVAVYATDEGPETFNLEGVAGNNSFWATGADQDGSERVTISGHISGNGNKLTGVGIETAADEVSELRFNVSRQ